MVAEIHTLEEIASLVKADMMLALGGMTLYRRPMSFVRSLIQRYLKEESPKNLTLFAFTAGMESDLLIGTGMVDSVRTCYFGLEIFGLAPMFTFMANHGEIKVIEETEASLSFGLRAQMAGIGFMPGRGWIGTDLPRLRPDVKTIKDPYNDEVLMAFPAIKPDIAVIHAICADRDGNAQIGRNKGVDEELALTSDIVVITTEKIVSELERADIPAPLVDYLVEAPMGAAPTSCHPLYPMDGLAVLDYVGRVSDPESWRKYVEHF